MTACCRLLGRDKDRPSFLNRNPPGASTDRILGISRAADRHQQNHPVPEACPSFSTPSNSDYSKLIDSNLSRRKENDKRDDLPTDRECQKLASLNRYSRRRASSTARFPCVTKPGRFRPEVNRTSTSRSGPTTKNP